MLLYTVATAEGKMDINKRLSNELRDALVHTVLLWSMAVQVVCVALYLVCGLSRCCKGCYACSKYSIAVLSVMGVYWYVDIKMQQNQYQRTMVIFSETNRSLNTCEFPEYFPGWLYPPFLVPVMFTWLKYLINQPMYEPHESNFARLDTVTTTFAAPALSLSFPGCHGESSYVLHPAVALLSNDAIPPIGSGQGDNLDSTQMSGLRKSLMGIATVTMEEAQRYNASLATVLQTGTSSVVVDDASTPAVGLVQAFCTDPKGRVEEMLLPHVPELPRLRKLTEKNAASPPSCPFSLSILLVDSVSMSKAMRVWPKLYAELNKINSSRTSTTSGSGSTSGTTTTTTTTTTNANHKLRSATTATSLSPPPASVFQFTRYHALGAYTNPAISTGFNVRPLFTGRMSETGDIVGTREIPHHRIRTETTSFWEEMRHKTGHTSWWANGQCSNYGDYMDRARMWTDVEFGAVACHPSYEKSGRFENGTYSNWNGPYSIFSRYIAGVPVHRYVLQYQRKWRQRYGGPSKLPTIGFMNFMEAHEGLEQVVKTMDQDLVEYLQEMKESGALDDTMVVLMADHGNDMGFKGVWKHASWMEKTHPFMTMIVPDALLARVGPEARQTLMKNSQRLVTAYDVHRTFLSMCSTAGGVDSSNGKETLLPLHVGNHRYRYNVPDQADGPYSLLHEEIPVTRTCRDALIPKSICACL